MITPQTPIRARLVGAALALSFAVGSQLSASAHAGSLAVFSCELPGGAPAPTEGWTSGWTAGTLPDAGSADSCTSPDGALSSFVGDQVSQPGSDGPFWEYTPPSGFTVVGGQLTAGFDIPGASATGYSAAAGMLGPQFQFDPADVIGGLPGGEWGSVESTWSLSGHTGGHIWLYSFCEPYGARCPAGGSTTSYWSTDELKQGIIVLSNNTSPTGSSFAGALTGPGAQTGTRNLVFQAADSGSGVYKVQVQLSGATLYSATPDTDAGRCVPDGSYGSSLEFTSASPCPRSESVTIPVNTAAVHDGQHELTVAVTDAAGNESIVYSQLVETRNAPVVLKPPAVTGPALVGGTVTADNATFSVPAGAGQLSAVSGQWMRCSDAAATRCSPIPAATGAGYRPSSSDIGYYLTYVSTAYDDDGATTATSQPTTAVAGASTPGAGVTPLGTGAGWAVTLNITPSHVHRGTTIRLGGAVTTSPRPAGGKLIYLQARSIGFAWIGQGRERHRVRTYGPWISFQTLRTHADGTWRSSYRFRLGGRHAYEMQAVAPREGGFQDPTGTSNIVTVTET